MRMSVAERTKGSSSRLKREAIDFSCAKEGQQILRLQRGHFIEIANQHRVAPSDHSARYSFRQDYLGNLARPQQAYRRKKIKCDKCTARKVDANLEKECDECEQ